MICMFLGAGLPKNLWGEFVTTIAYLINKHPCTSINFETLIWVWSGKLIDFSYSNIFEALALNLIKQEKLDAKVVNVFIGNPKGVKGWKMWKKDPIRSKFIIIKDVIFNDIPIWGWSANTLEVKESETMIKMTQFEVKVPISETGEEEILETPVSSTIERHRTLSPNYQLAEL